MISTLGRVAAIAVRLLDRVVDMTGRACAWLVVVLVGITVYDVVMRYLFRAGSVALQELEWHLFAAVFLLAGAYTLKHDAHVRVDLIYRSRWLSERTRGRIDLLGTVFFLLPFCALVVWSSLPFVTNSMAIGETSPDPGGLAHRWVAKALIPVGFSLLLVQGLSVLLQALRDRAGFRASRPEQP